MELMDKTVGGILLQVSPRLTEAGVDRKSVV